VTLRVIIDSQHLARRNRLAKTEYGKVDSITHVRRKGTARLTESTRMAQLAALSADDKKGLDVKILDIRALTTVADHFIVCSGTNVTHVRAIADYVEEQVSSQGLALHHSEGYQNGRWVLLDFVDIVVHVMHQEEREFYNLDRLWGDAQQVEFNRSQVG